MNRKQLITIVALGVLVLSGAAYAPHSETMTRLAKQNAHVAPCSTTFPSNYQQPQQAAAYPVPSEDVIARGHSAN